MGGEIEKAVLLPLGGSPEGGFFYHTNEQVLELYRRHPDRIIPFCNIDPRFGDNAPTTDFSWLLAEYKELGVRGVGEITANLYIDDPMAINLFRQCGDAGLPVTFHLACKIGGVYGVADDLGLPRLEKVLRECPDTVFFGHAMSFWSPLLLLFHKLSPPTDTEKLSAQSVDLPCTDLLLHPRLLSIVYYLPPSAHTPCFPFQ